MKKAYTLQSHELDILVRGHLLRCEFDAQFLIEYDGRVVGWNYRTESTTEETYAYTCYAELESLSIFSDRRDKYIEIRKGGKLFKAVEKALGEEPAYETLSELADAQLRES